MAVKDLDTPLHRLMQHLQDGYYTNLTDEFADSVRKDFAERVEEVQTQTKDKRSFLFLKSFIDKVKRKQYNAAYEHLQAARQQYQSFMLQYESLPNRKKQPAPNPNPQTRVNEVNQPNSITNQSKAINSGSKAMRPAKSPPPPYTPRLPKDENVQVHRETISPTDINERRLPPKEKNPPQERQDINRASRPAIFKMEDSIPKETERGQKKQRVPLFFAQSPNNDRLVTPWKHALEFKPNASSYDRDRDMPWLPAPEDVRPYFVSREQDNDRKLSTQNRPGPKMSSPYHPNIRDSHLYSNVYDTYNAGSKHLPAIIERRRSPEPSIIRTNSQLQLENLYNSQRPSKLSERFLNLYFGEYAHAFKEMTTRGMKDRSAVFYLLQIVTEAYEHCRTAVELNLNEKPKSKGETSENSSSSEVNKPEFQVHPNLEQKRIKAAKMLPYAREDFIQKTYPDIIPRKLLAECLRTKAYAEKSIEICWWMCVREPPIILEWVPERANDQPYQTFHRAIYDPYTQGGSHLEFMVWPAIRLYEQGPILSKGIAQGITPDANNSV